MSNTFFQYYYFTLTMRILIVLVCFSLLYALSVNGTEIRQTVKPGETCTAVITSGYKYTEWYDAPEYDGQNDSVLLKFYAQSASTSSIMLSPDIRSSGYEILLGSGLNSVSELRKNNRWRPMKISERVKIDSFDPVGFWIRTSHKSGLIEVGKDSETVPFLFWVDPIPLTIKHFSFSSKEGGTSKWLFNCRPADTEKPDNVEQFLTYAERLRRDVLKNRRTFSYDNPATNQKQFLNVQITSDFKFIHLDVMTSTLTLRGFATFEWPDNSIHWNPTIYRNISKLHLSNYELWRPELVLHNANDPAVGIFSEENILVDNLGRVTWRPKFDAKTKCDVDVSSWPWDRHSCVVLLSPWSHKILNVFYEIKKYENSDCFQIAHSDWKLDRITSTYVQDSVTPWDDIVASINDHDGDGSSEDSKHVSLQLVIHISRNTKILQKLFYTPLILISCIWLSSFWIMSSSSSKFTIISVLMIISTLIVVYMTMYVPVFIESPPKLMVRYLRLMLLMSTDVMVSCVLVTVRSSGGHPPFAVTRFLTTPAVARLLVLPKMNPNDYDQLPENDGPDAATYNPWHIVVAAVERIAFVAYFATAAVVLRFSV